MEKIKILKDEVIFAPNQRENDPAFYFIEEGVVDLYIDDKKSTIQELLAQNMQLNVNNEE